MVGADSIGTSVFHRNTPGVDTSRFRRSPRRWNKSGNNGLKRSKLGSRRWRWPLGNLNLVLPFLLSFHLLIFFIYLLLIYLLFSSRGSIAKFERGALTGPRPPQPPPLGKGGWNPVKRCFMTGESSLDMQPARRSMLPCFPTAEILVQRTMYKLGGFR